MASTGVGLGLPNRRLELGELDQIVGLGLTDYVVYFDSGEQDYWRGVCALIRERQPGARLHLRVERRGALTAQTDAVLITNVARFFGNLCTTVRCRNEVNLESPGETPQTWQSYLTQLSGLLPAAIRGRVYVPAISPGPPDWLAWLDASVQGGRELGGLDCHVYGSLGWDVPETLHAHRDRWRSPRRLLVTEYNPSPQRRWTEEDWANDLPIMLAVGGNLGVEAVCLFLWDWSAPDSAVVTPVDVKAYPAVQQALKEAAKDARLAAAKKQPEVPQAVTTLRLAVFPSCQTYNSFTGADGRPTDERAQMTALAAQVAAVAQTYKAVEVKVFRGGPETDTKNLPCLKAQLKEGYAWLGEAPAGTLTVGLHLHSDGLTPEERKDPNTHGHVGAYWGSAPITQRLAASLLEAVGKLFYGARKVGGNYEAEQYLAWTLAGGRHCPVLLELGCHDLPDHVRRVATGGAQIAEAVVGSLVEFFPVSRERQPAAPPVVWSEVGLYSQWAQARVAARQEPRCLEAFSAHLKALGCPPEPFRFGWPVAT